MFKIGDKIVYPMHGAGTIIGIETKKILGQTHEYYILSIPVGDMKVMIPTDNLDEIGIRDVSTETEADEVIDVFKTCEEEVTENNWNKRYRDNIERMKKGDLADIARITKSLLLKDRKKSLSNAERKMLNNAKQILVSELVLAEHATQDEVEELVDNKINTSFAMFKTDTNMEVSTGSIVNKFIPFDNNSSQND